MLGDQGKLDEAEALTRECLALSGKKLPEDWRTFSARSTRGGDLLRHQEFAEAEQLFLSGFEGLKMRESEMPAADRPVLLKSAVERLVQLYEATGRPDKAAEWKKRLEVPGQLNPETKAGAEPK